MEKQQETTSVHGYACKVCTKSFKTRRGLKRHMTTHMQEREHECSYCRMRFTLKSDLARHMITHGGEGKFNCSVCNKGFAHNSTLKIHMAVHTGNWKFKCEVCGKGYPQKSTYLRHMSVHTKVSRYKCSKCGKGAFNRSEIVRHMASSHNKEPLVFRCQFCNEAFGQKPDLMSHMHLHLLDTNLKCEFCEQSFSNKTALIVHMSTHTNSGRVQCRLCSKPTEGKNFLCGTCKTQGPQSSQERRNSKKRGNSRTEVYGKGHVRGAPSKNSEKFIHVDDSKYVKEDSGCVNNLGDQLYENELGTADLVGDKYSRSDSDPNETEILGLGSEFDEFEGVDPISIESDYVNPVTCVFIEEKPLNSGVVNIKKECSPDIENVMMMYQRKHVEFL